MKNRLRIKYIKSNIGILLSIVLVSLCCFATPMNSIQVQASNAYVEAYEVELNGVVLDRTVSSMDLSYDNNRYINVCEISKVLSDTEASFIYEYSNDTISIYTNKEVVSSQEISDDEEDEEVSLEDSDRVRQISVTGKYRDMTLNDEKITYYTIIADHNDSGESDCFMAPYDLAMLLDIDIQIVDDSRVVIDTTKHFSVDPDKLEEDGYFQAVNAIIVGNATTSEIYYSYQASTPYAIASTTKLMTYLVVREYMEANSRSMQDITTISDNAELLSKSDDGVIPMTAGTQVSIEELMYGMLLPSSNECALALAEYAYGSEDIFVEKMNAKAKELELNTAQFINCNGLPKYTESTVSSKLQNRLSAEDMFRLSSYILSVYPDIKEITSTQKVKLEALKQEVKNSNPVLANMPECTGLKTGTTNKAGACLVNSVEVATSSGAEDLVVVLLGAENSVERGRVAQILSNYAIDVRMGDADALYTGHTEYDESIPTTAEGFINLITKAARNKYLAAD